MKDPEKSFDFQLNIGFVVFAIIFIYLTITVIASFMKETISVCRVEEGQIVNSASFTGVCVRDEEVVTSTGNGYINFYVGEGEKVANAGNIYLLSSEAPESSSENLQDTAGTSTEITAKSGIRFLFFQKLFKQSVFTNLFAAL